MKKAFKQDTVLKYAALVLTAVFLFAFTGCSTENGGQLVVVDIEENTAAPVTAAPTGTPAPTQQPTDVPIETPAPTAEINPAGQKRKIYLTFDDGPYEYTDEVLSILAEYKIKATFFTIGRFMYRYTDTLKRMANDGHVIGCHTDSHDFNIIYQSPEAFLADVARWRAALTEAVGYDCGAYVLRFPGGTTNSSIGGRSGRGAYVDAVNAAGYYAFDWAIGFNDKWLAGNTENLPKSEYFWKSYLETYAYYGKTEPLILIIHDTEEESVKLLRRLLDDLIAKGFEFDTCDHIGDNYLM